MLDTLGRSSRLTSHSRKRNAPNLSWRCNHVCSPSCQFDAADPKVWHIMNFHQLSERSDILRPMAQKVLRKCFCPIFWVLSYLQCSNKRLTHPHLLQGQIPLWLPGWTSDLHGLHGFGQGKIVKIHQNTHPRKSSKDIVPMKSNETLKRFFNSSTPRLTWAVDHFHNLSDQFLGDRYLTTNRGESTRSLVLIKCGNCASIILTRSHKYTTT
jgi:hypothetical protein